MRTLLTTFCLLGLVVASPVFAAEKSKAAPVALDGNCAVCLLKGGNLVPGSEEYSVEFDGKTYLFPSEKVKETFAESPEKFVPALNGDCIVCFVHGGARAAGSTEFHTIYENRIYLFPSQGTLDAFKEEPKEFASADLAYDGNCAVCLIDGGNKSPGKAEFTAIHDGFRYQFPNEELKKMFQKSPEKYAVKTEKAKETASTSSSDEKLVSIEGHSACAACEFKVRPTKDQDELGLAIVVSDDEIYVIEKAHENYEKIYDDRFSALKLAAKGKVIKKQGKFTWLDSAEVKIVK